MKFKIKVTDGLSEWWEGYDKEEVETLDQAKKFGADIVQSYNDTLRPGERVRTYLDTELVGVGTLQHQWEKQNSITISDRRGMYDFMRCRRCGCEARRFGFTDLQRTEKYRAAKWKVCHEPGS